MKINSAKIMKNLKKMSLYSWILIILIATLMICIVKKRYNSPMREGFTQSERFTTKRGEEIYDTFYTQIYDDLFFKQFSTQFEVGTIINETSPTRQSIILEIGSKTGNLLGLLKEKGYDNLTGLETTQEMVEKAKENYPDIDFKKGNAAKTMIFDSASFTHIMIMNLTFYHFQDQRQLLQNCFDWLKPGGYIIINLVNKDLFNPLPPASNPLFLISPQRFAKKRMTKGVVKFNNFNYESNFFIFPNDMVKFSEIFEDTTTGNVRQNELGLFMPKQMTIISMAQEIGFISLSKIDLVKGQKEYQYLYIFYKPN